MDSLTIRSGDKDYLVEPLDISIANLRKLYEKMSPFQVVFGKKVETPEDFISIFMSYSRPSGDPQVNGLFWSIDGLETGVYYITNIFLHEADAHFVFFDKRVKGKEDLTRQVVDNVMEYFKFRRLNITIPCYVNHRVNDFVRRIGGAYEGKKYKSALYNNQWFDEKRYVIFNPEISLEYSTLVKE